MRTCENTGHLPSTLSLEHASSGTSTSWTVLYQDVTKINRSKKMSIPLLFYGGNLKKLPLIGNSMHTVQRLILLQYVSL